MGADLIGYIVKGPVKITKARQQKAIEYLDRVFIIYNNANGDNEYMAKTMPKPASDLLDADECQFNNILEENIKFKTNDIVKAIVSFWHNPHYRDVCYVSDPDDKNQLIVFAGDMSWGDSPEGTGYRELDRMYWLGVNEALGIKF